ncbi:MAG: hypothetical protein QOE76_4328 [Frankiales bacterium]|nr:hypothetical protein [Frankiales bacterium]
MPASSAAVAASRVAHSMTARLIVTATAAMIHGADVAGSAGRKTDSCWQSGKAVKMAATLSRLTQRPALPAATSGRSPHVRYHG